MTCRSLRCALLASFLAAAPAHTDEGLSLLQDDDASLSLSAWTQIRYTANLRDAPGAGDDLTHGFSLRRTRMTAEGAVGELSYKLTASFSRNGGDADLSDAYVEMPLSDTLSIQAGQFKAPLLKEELTSAKRLLTADRSLTNSVFTLSRVQGVALAWEIERYRATVALHDGADGAGLEWNDSSADFAVTARDEWLIVGNDFRPFREATSPRANALAIMLGGALDYEALDQPAAFDNMLTATVDLDVKGDGWGVMGAGIIRHQWGGDEGFTDVGLVAQAGVYLDETIELFGRADVIFADPDRPDDDPFPGLTIGVTRYVIGHAAKITADLQYFPTATSGNALVGSSTGIGLLESDGAQLVGRVQMQVVF